MHLVNDKDKCSGCEACRNACPVNAISMERDKYGDIYPMINNDVCISCNKCKQVCNFNNIEVLHENLRTYAYASQRRETIDNSTSGGAFADIARQFLNNGGVVYGAAWDDQFNVLNIRIVNVDNLIKLQGSKYVQSKIGDAYIQVRADLEDNLKVLFSGTPCQIAGLYGFLGKKLGQSNNLFTIDIICHGVPNIKFLNETLDYMVGDRNNIQSIKFRDKMLGWGTGGSIKAKDKTIPFDSIHSAYYYYYLTNSTYRESCYHCQFAGGKRCSDITLGDYWGIERIHPDIFNVRDIKNGVSCVLVNTLKGKNIIDSIEPFGKLYISNLKFVKKMNSRLNKCEPAPLIRKKLREVYLQDGVNGLEQYFRTTEKKAIIKLRINELLPITLKVIIKRLLAIKG